MVNLQEDLTSHMNQSELYEKLGWNAVKGFITSIILIAAFVKLIDLVTKYGFLLSVGQIALFCSIVMGYYYYYYWSSSTHPDNSMRKHNDKIILTWKDFFYTDKIKSDDNSAALSVSFILGAGTYVGFAILIGLAKYCLDNSGSESTMSILRIAVIGLIATIVYIYTQRYSLNESFWKTVFTCTIYGFSLSLSTYLLGIIIGISNMVFGVPLTIAIITLQIVFTTVYTYMDLVKWAKETHIRIVTEEQKKIFVERAKKAAKEGKSLLCEICRNNPESCGTKPEPNELDTCKKFLEIGYGNGIKNAAKSGKSRICEICQKNPVNCGFKLESDKQDTCDGLDQIEDLWKY